MAIGAITAAALPASALAQHRLHLELGVGGDSNPALASDPQDRAMMNPNVVRPSALVALDVEANLRLAEGRGHGLGLAPYVSTRAYSSPDAYTDGGLSLRWEYVGAKAGMDLSVLAGGYGATFGLDNAAYAEGLLGASIGLGAMHVLRLESYYQLRVYTADQQDDLLGGAIALFLRSRAVEGFLRLGADYRLSTADASERSELIGSVGLSVFTGDHRVSLQSSFATRFFRNSDRDGNEWLGTVRYDYRVTPKLGLFASLSAGWAAAARGSAESLRYERASGLAGITLTFESAPRVPERARRQGPAEILDDGRVRFHVRAPGASEVALLADFLDWDPERGRLTPQGDDVFEGTFAPGPGRHRYRLLVDDEDVIPEAPAYAPDGFGGRDAILRIDPPDATAED